MAGASPRPPSYLPCSCVLRDAACFRVASPRQLQGGRAAAALLLSLGVFQPGSGSLREPSANCSLPGVGAEQGGSSAWMAVPLSNTSLGDTAQCPVAPPGTVEDRCDEIQGQCPLMPTLHPRKGFAVWSVSKICLVCSH